MKQPATVSETLRKACTHKKQPEIPTPIANDFKPWTHCEIRAYHQRISYKKVNGKPKRSRHVYGFIFIFCTHYSGDRMGKPIRIIHKKEMSRRDFVNYTKKLVNNTNGTLLTALTKSTH